MSESALGAGALGGRYLLTVLIAFGRQAMPGGTKESHLLPPASTQNRGAVSFVRRSPATLEDE
jgi:hypothetical protein